jgi:TorA maturation chaperone TorD
MGRDDTSTGGAAGAALDPAGMLAARSGVYAVLARGFGPPDDRTVEFFRQCDETAFGEDGEISRAVRQVVAAAKGATADELKAAYMRLFHPLNGPFPYETEHQKTDEFARAQRLADIMGFYRAFGVEPASDRPDHIAAELEFMHLLTLKEAHALAAGDPANAAVCREAGEEFLREHLATWTDELLEAMRAAEGQAPAPFYEHLMDLLQLFMETEKENVA